VHTRDARGCYPAEAELEWEQLWATHIAGANLTRTDVEDAAVICFLGWELAMEHHDYSAAVRRLESWFTHPQAEFEDPITRAYLRSEIGFSQLLGGSEPVAVESFRTLLRSAGPKDGRLLLYRIRNHLFSFCAMQPESALASALLVQLTAEVVGGFSGKKRVVTTLAGPGVTYGQLTIALQKTYPR